MTGIRKYWAIIPAAGVGRRMGGSVPKQYCKIGGFPMVHYSLLSMCENSAISGVAIGVAENDSEWQKMTFEHDRFMGSFSGGNERSDTVANGLEYLISQPQTGNKDWVFVHDAARPCVTQDEINAMIEAAENSADGVVLGVKVEDTLKKVNPMNEVIESPNRDQYWRAFTPQLFPVAALQRSLLKAREEDFVVTDECMAMEYSGYKPRMLQGNPGNIKITWPSDIELATRTLTENSL